MGHATRRGGGVDNVGWVVAGDGAADLEGERHTDQLLDGDCHAVGGLSTHRLENRVAVLRKVPRKQTAYTPRG